MFSSEIAKFSAVKIFFVELILVTLVTTLTFISYHILVKHWRYNKNNVMVRFNPIWVIKASLWGNLDWSQGDKQSWTKYLAKTLALAWQNFHWALSYSWMMPWGFLIFLNFLFKPSNQMSFDSSCGNSHIPVYYQWSRFVILVVKGKFDKSSQSDKILCP